LGLTVLADPFWGRVPWLLKRRGGNTASKKSAGPSAALVCRREYFVSPLRMPFTG
jgi:hypothetical protein